MEKTTTLYADCDIYHETQINDTQLTNKLFCTFTSKECLDELLDTLTSRYTILYDKIFVLESSNGEYVCTYNIDNTNISNLPGNTILVHRKKEHNVLYTINALNELIKKLNGGVVDPTYQVEWGHYRNTILLTQQNELKQLKTKLHKIIEL